MRRSKNTPPENEDDKRNLRHLCSDPKHADINAKLVRNKPSIRMQKSSINNKMKDSKCKKDRDLEIDNMIENLHKPRIAEQFRIRKLVEDQFLKINEQVQKEIQENLAEMKVPKER